MCFDGLQVQRLQRQLFTTQGELAEAMDSLAMMELTVLAAHEESMERTRETIDAQAAAEALEINLQTAGLRIK